MKHVVLCAVAGFLLGCGPGEAATCVAGHESCVCYVDDSCNAGLGCKSGFCVKLSAHKANPSSGEPVAGEAGRVSKAIAGKGSDAAVSGGDGGVASLAASGRMGSAGVAGVMGSAGVDGMTRGVIAGAGAAALHATGSGGSAGANTAGSSAGSSGQGGSCASTAGGDCSSEACCAGVLCVQSVCAASCSRNQDCLTGCCTKSNSGESVCAPAELCPPPDVGPGVAPLPPGSVVESHIVSAFDGWTGETIFKLENGQYWQQASRTYTYHYAYRPAVRIAMEAGSYRMTVDGIDGSIPVELLNVVVESQIVSDFNGWDGATMFELANGQVWEQTAPANVSHHASRPLAAIYRKNGHFELTVDGVDSSVQVKQLR